MADAVAVILAAGQAARMKTNLPKPLHRVSGRTLLEYALDVVVGAGIADAAVVAPRESSQFEAIVDGRVACVPGGKGIVPDTQAALAKLPDADTVLLVPCDLPQLRPDHLQALLGFHRNAAADATALVVGGSLTDVMAARRTLLAGLDPEVPPEELFPDARACELAGEPLINIDTRADLVRAEKALRRMAAERLLNDGVTIVDPDNTYIDLSVEIGLDTVVYPWTIIEGKTVIGERCVIGPHAHLINCTIGDDVAIEAAVARESRIRSSVRVGPYAQIRPGCDVGEGTKIGDFVELKNARLGRSVSVAHLAYVGDAEIGDRANIGAGVITCNYDGFRKHRTTVGANAFIGSNSVLIAPVEVGAGAYVAANSAINQDVPADALGIARARQENKLEWARRKREARRKE